LKNARWIEVIPSIPVDAFLEADLDHDDRTDLLKSTRAAARYLRDLYETFSEWRLALPAYDAAEGAMREAIQRAKSRDFQEISDRGLIPAETRSCVPAVLGAVNLLNVILRALTAPTLQTALAVDFLFLWHRTIRAVSRWD
jgi:hypothetical protein